MRAKLRITFAPLLADSPKYRPEIDGLRAIAILPVLFYHAGLPAFSGGYVGVDIFFVISGYLITSIVAKDIALGRFSFAAFYERRIRRIFPALFFVLFVCAAAAAVFFPPRDFRDFGESLVAMTFFVSNLFFWRTASPTGYFDDTSQSQVLLHTWTLSVEEQFYIFLPIGLALVNRWAKQHLKVCLLTAVIASFSLSLWAIEHKPIAAFYLLPPRAWELLIGSLLAVGVLPAIGNRILRDAAGFAGLGLIAYAVFAFTKDSQFPGFRALAPCVGAWLIIYASQPGASWVKAILGVRPLAFIGVISYSLYLWHWPIIVFVKYFWVSSLTGTQTVQVIVLSLVMASVSFEFIESPFRRPNSVWTRWQILRFGSLASLGCAVLGLAITLSQGFPQRYDVRTQKLIAANTERKTQDWQLIHCGHWHKEVHSAEEAASCSIGGNLAKKILFWGDSHVEQLHSSVKRLYDAGSLNNHGVLFALAEACPPTEKMDRDVPDSHCDNFGHFAMLRAQQDDVDTVFIGFATWWDVIDLPFCAVVDGRCEGSLSRAEMERRLIDELSQHIQALKMLGKKVVVALPFPIYKRSIPDLQIHNAMFAWLDSTFRPLQIDSLGLRDRIRSTATAAGAVLFDPRESLCDDQACIYQRDNVSIYTDPSHIADSETGILDASLGAALR
jgi:peptidoglycan/LPS O-acetylase OafA/YrhL